MTGSTVRQLAAWTGRLLLLGAVAFWWGAVVTPQLISLALPTILPWGSISLQLQPDVEGNLVNAVSAASLLIVALLAVANALRSRRRGAGLIAVGGWSATAITSAYLAWAEISEFHIWSAGVFNDAMLGDLMWPVVLSPLAVTFLLAMGVFLSRGLPRTSSGRHVRILLISGLVAWGMVILIELFGRYLPNPPLIRLFEETLEFGGTLLIGLGAGVALGSHAVSRSSFGLSGKRRLLLPLVGSMASIALLGGVTAALLFRAPLADARASSSIGSFHIVLYDKHSLVQELGVLPAPPSRFDLRLTSRTRESRPRILIWRIVEAGSGHVFREGRKEVPAGDRPSWERIDFAPLVEAEGRPLALQLIADVGPRAHLQVGATKTNRYEEGRLWVDGELTWPDQNIEFAAYGRPELSDGKLRAMWHVLSSGWRWTVLRVDTAIAVTLVILLPALLSTAALSRRGLP
ncbi:MAG: hypothetical protein OXG46_06085 [Chloroflexi bacterium]|nr:hypothetical protein [Chloroflexota bacterium]